MPDAIDTEITPLMIAAGAVAFEEARCKETLGSDEKDVAEMLRSVYRAMRKAKLRLTDYPDTPSAA